MLLAAALVVVATYFFAVSNTNSKWEVKVLEERAVQAKAIEEHRKIIADQQAEFDFKQAVLAMDFEDYKKLNKKIEYREVVKYVTKESDDKCTIPLGFVRLHDRAASNDNGQSDAKGGSKSNDLPTKVKLSTVGNTVAGNYNTCNEEMKKLELLQEVVRKFQEQQK